MSDNKLEWGAPITFSPLNSYYPLILEYVDHDTPNNGWKLELQLRPEPRLSFTGKAVPSLESIVAVLRPLSQVPVWFIEVVQVLAGHELAQQKLLDSSQSM